MTEGIQERFEFAAHFPKPVFVEFDGDQSSSDRGALLLSEVNRRLRLTERLAQRFTDQRDQRRVEHSVAEMLRRRMFPSRSTMRISTIRNNSRRIRCCAC